MTAPQDVAPHRGLAPSTRTLISLAAGVVVLAGVYFARGLFGPLALAAVVVIIVQPVRGPLERRGWPRWAATTGMIVVAYLILGALAALLAFAGVQFANLVGQYLDDLAKTVNQITSWLESFGVEGQVADAVSSWLDPSTIAGLAATVGGTAMTVLTAFFFVLAYVIFMAADSGRYQDAHARFGVTRPATLARITSYNSGVRRYFVVNATFGAVVAVIDGLALWWMGVPAPAVWAILAFVTNFIPNIGFVLGVVPPTVMALVVGGWPLALGVVAVYCVVNVVLQVLVQPKFVADAVNLSLTLSFFSVVFWTLVIGPLGAILAIPLTLLTRALVIEGDPDAGWLRYLSGDTSGAPPAAGPAPAKADAPDEALVTPTRTVSLEASTGAASDGPDGDEPDRPTT
ncbi:AI-2E family transporter [Oerskovia enterophila]|uniref:AI-2 transport protein TqsA n=1 Tax=Oerskovia enterophila TaxID=43678 RepID=A0ABX2YAV3_9CELL|nr:AI-2E family transporter [Oerskovia enterophila]OCI33156.1 AI-2 transport protein TqsA [Oerskovia enterophila]